MVYVARLLAIAGAAFAAALPAAAADLFNNTNTGAVANGTHQGPSFVTTTPVQVTQIVTYHWNNGRGAPPGTLELKSLGGQTYGPFKASGTAGQGNAPNVNWIANVNLTLPAGTYQVIDSDPVTWSQNAQSHGIGFAIIRGDRVAAASAPQAVPLTAPSRLPPSPSVPVARAPQAPAPSPAPASGPGPGELFNNYNSATVQNRPTGLVLLLVAGTEHVTQLQTYHWNNGRGAAPGTLTLKSMNGPVYGPFRAKGVPGPNNVPNANWVADVNLTLTLGTYQLLDSDPATWSQNAQSHGVGFAIIRGTRTVPTAPTPAGTPAPAAGGGSGGGASFKPCMVNAGSVAAMSPCQGAPGTKITFQLSRTLKSPIAKVTFKPYQVRGIPAGSVAQVISAVKGNSTAAGSFYEVDVPQQLCTWGNGFWDLYLYDQAGSGQGDIGRFGLICGPGAVAGGGGAPPPTIAAPAPAPGPAPFKPCFVNSGSVAQVSPCTVHPGDIVTVRLTRTLKAPLGTITFKPQQTGLPSGTTAQVMVKVSGKAAAGSDYDFPAPKQLCVGGTVSWDVWPYDTAGKGQGDIGRVNVICR